MSAESEVKLCTPEEQSKFVSLAESLSVDVAPVVHAHWETDEHAALDFCSSCGEAVERYVTAEQMDKSNYKGATYWNYCPHCGAKMDEAEIVGKRMIDGLIDGMGNNVKSVGQQFCNGEE